MNWLGDSRSMPEPRARSARGVLRAKSEPRARNAQESRAKPKSRAKPDIEQKERYEEGLVWPLSRKFLKIHILETVQSWCIVSDV